MKHGDYNWACFKIHQAVEKALKALLWGIGKPKTGHSLRVLARYLMENGINVDEEIFKYCVELSKYYIPTRYPDVWSEGAPEDYYTLDETQGALKKGEKVVKWVKNTWRKLSEKG